MNPKTMFTSLALPFKSGFLFLFLVCTVFTSKAEYNDGGKGREAQSSVSYETHQGDFRANSISNHISKEFSIDEPVPSKTGKTKKPGIFSLFKKFKEIKRSILRQKEEGKVIEPLSVTAMSLGILSYFLLGIGIFVSGFLIWPALLFALIALGLGIGGLVRTKQNPDKFFGKGMALAGLLLGALFPVVLLILFIIVWVLIISLFN